MHGGKFEERFRSKPENVAKAKAEAASKRIARSIVPFTKLHDPQFDVALNCGTTAFTLYAILAREYRRHRHQPFQLKLDALATVEGLSLRNMPRILFRLEACGLISVCRASGKPIVITDMK